MSLIHERQTLRAMISLYCGLHHHSDSLCKNCSELLEYTEKRLARCPFGDEKPACRGCLVHCYTPEMRERIAEVMRFSGPRLIFHNPILALRHLLHNKRSKKPVKGEA